MRTTQKQLIHRMLVLAIGICILTAACGSDNDKTATAKPSAASNAAAAESPYCDAAREWAVDELTPFDDTDPVAFRAYWDRYLAFMEQGTDLSPAPIHDDWGVYAAAVAKQTPVLEKFGYDKGKFDEQGTPEEKAPFESPSPEAEQAFDSLLRYEALTCATAQPPAAEVDFSKEKKAEAYCEAVAKNNEMVGELRASGFQPTETRTLITSKEFEAVIEAEYKEAPKVIKDDAEALHTFWQEEQLAVWAEQDYDLRKVLLDGPHADREVLQSTAPSIRDHYARAAAYEEQVCGAE